MLAFENFIRSNKTEFIRKVNAVSSYLGIQPDWLMTIMFAESTLNEKAVNRVTRATGLIQFMPATAVGLGTTVDYLLTLSNVEQLDWVQKYYAPYRNRLKSVYDLYLVTFFPVALGKADNWVMQTSRLSARIIAEQNPGVDINKDGQITVGEFKQYVDKILQKKK